jgi:hypothetical protein
MKRVPVLGILVALACAVTTAPSLQAQGAPVTGNDVLERMRKKYNGKWYRTLTFTQTTTLAGRGGSEPIVQTWYESLQFGPPRGGVLRIDNGSPAKGNGSLSSADSTWTVSADTLARTSGSGNPFIPLIENVYLQPVAVTVKQLEPLHFDMSRVVEASWLGRPAWVVGVASASDTTSPQFWIDKERLVVVRMVVILAPNRPPYDIHLDNLVETGGGWLATKVTMLVNGTPRQTEEYYDWKTNVTLDPKLFDVMTWGTATHWVKQP